MISPIETIKKEEQKHNIQNNNNNRVRNELTEYFNYITLLSKKRNPANIKIIENYIKKENNILQRICFIEDLDRKEKKITKIETEKDKKTIQKKKYNSYYPNSKKKLEKVSLIKYILSTRRAIYSFGHRTNIIEFNFIISPKLTDTAHKRYQEYLKQVGNILIKPIAHIVHHGWQELDLQVYNTIVTFHKFLNQMLKAGNILKNNDLNTTYKNMEQFIQPYLQIVANPKNINTIKEAVYETLFFTHEFKPEFRTILATINKILNVDSRKISFFNIILGIFMLKYRFFYTLPKIKGHYNVNQINDKHYDLSRKIILNIKEELSVSQKAYSDSEKELFFLQFIEEDFYIDNKINKTKYIHIVFSKIYCVELLINMSSIDNIKNSRDEENINFINHLKEDIIYTISRFIKGFILTYTQFLNGKEVSIASKSGSILEKKLFAKWLFAKELEGLEYCQAELTSFRKNNAYLSIQWQRYEEYNIQSRFDITKEEKLCGLVKQAVGIIYSIANKTSLILYKHYKASSLADKDKILIKSTQQSSIKDVETSPRFIPYATFFIKNNPNLEKLSVIETLNEISSFTINFCELMRYKQIVDRKDDKEKHLQKVEHFFSIYSKIPHIKTNFKR